MQIRTPKKYQGVQRRSIIGCRRLAFYLLMLALIAIGIAVILNQATLAPIVQSAVFDFIGELEDTAATMAVPEPTPTLDPRNSLGEANNYWLGGALDEATDLYINIAASMPNSVEVYRRIALGLINESRYGEAVEYGERAVNADPFDAEAWAIYAWALDWDRRAAEALAKARYAQELDPANSRAIAYLAEVYSSLGQAERADLLLEDLLEDQPDSAEGIRARGLLKWNRNDFAGALEDFKRAYGLAQNMSYIAVDIAIIEKDLGNYETAQEFLQQVVDADPYNPHALFRLGEIAVSFEGNPAQAMRYLQDCIDLNPRYLYCHFMLGRAQERLGSIDDAAASFAKAIELGSDNPQHYYWAGYAQILLGNCARAMGYLEPGLRLALQTATQRFAADIEAIIPQCDPTFIGRADLEGG
ncbi:MAG: tetratricopeptide repeat protein [Chloroflexota bacterium]|nr:tetratricopeptide repeat protein [Chloroflexota bacterium]MDE2910923.1 tetratricopeptide repeat protein [Chloroflexota bacterium]